METKAINILPLTCSLWKTAYHGALPCYTVPEKLDHNPLSVLTSKQKLVKDPTMANFSSFLGRGLSLQSSLGCILPGVLCPLIMLIAAIVKSIMSAYYKCSGDVESAKKYGWSALDNLCFALTCTVGYTILAVRGVLGCIIHPRIYFNPELPAPAVQ